ncbi:YbhB/YbcL family Raf kinase inhibitor-like protein [Cupriavidus sp. WGlv3]|uniref:YbhB/YbcL family Raf kinase inhibitor-like protein n=1 Tax=Cupriavidus sp. WGlv3 TaxID=2919924 RepID=UPI002091BE8C|nr:YbhB/YbcL family Raf kinase inhibitor-like protein [Cupriavidus sp. WGlv3]MCO4862537.1 YbhB/YbcL family Raf kinase inhibitor-like protein [Cupriavidus sp. WGlv3]
MLRHRKLLWGFIFAAVTVGLLLAPLPWSDRTAVHVEVVIARPLAQVFDYVATPRHWPAWHPASLGVAGATDHPLERGERVAETFMAAQRGGVVVWTVIESQRPRTWSIEGVAGGQRVGTITYRLTPAITPSLTPAAERTRFEREFRYRSPTLLFALINRLMLREQLQAESTEALRRLKAVLETEPPPSPRAALRGAPIRPKLEPSLIASSEARMPFQLQSTAFAPGGEIPAQHTCEGADISPPLAWTGLPQGTASLALIVDDPDAPDPAAPKMTWVHWLLYNLPADAAALPADIASAGLPAGTRQGLNDWQRTGYGGPCPPIGRHRYVFKLYALDVALPDIGQPDKPTLERAMQGHMLAKAELIGTYQKSKR